MSEINMQFGPVGAPSKEQVKQVVQIVMSFLNGVTPLWNNATLTKLVELLNSFVSQDWFIDLLTLLMGMAGSGASQDDIKRAVTNFAAH